MYSPFTNELARMDDQVEKFDVYKMQVLENAFKVNDIKKECQDDDLEDYKVYVSETAVIDGVELQDHLTDEKIKQYDISTTLDNIKSELSSVEIKNEMVNECVKVEEGISAVNIKTEFNSGSLYCEHCCLYYQDYCTVCGMLVQILNRNVLNNTDTSRKELPRDDILEIQDYFGQFRIFALKVIPEGVQFGPFTGLTDIEHSWRIKGGKFIVDADKSKYLNWMQYVSHARNIFERNLVAFQYERNIYYKSTRQIQGGDELLVDFGEEYESSLNENVEADFTPTTDDNFKEAFACVFCCLGFSSKLYLAKHKTICPEAAAGEFSIEALTQCPLCKIHMDQKEYFMHHVAYCCNGNDRKWDLSASGNRTPEVNGRKAGSGQLHKCPQCNYRTKYKSDLKRHSLRHCEVQTYKCGACGEHFKTIESLKLHAEQTKTCAAANEDPEPFTCDVAKQLQCSLCPFQTNYKISLKAHIKAKHLNEFKYKCDMCAYKTNRNSHLSVHINAKHLKEFTHKCDECEYKANTRSSLKLHVKTKHLKEFNFECETCGYKTNRNSHLKVHMNAKHLKEFKYKCDRCDYITIYKSNLDYHVKTKHLNEFYFKCDACDYKTNMKMNLRRHVQTKHLRQFNFKCELCDYNTNDKSNLVKHVKAKHLNEFYYKCETCDYSTNNKVCLDNHVKAKHSKKFNYQCDKCDYHANYKANFENHVKAKHLNEFDYKCEFCEYKTNEKKYLVSHGKAKHAKEFTYSCDACDYRTNNKSNLENHVKAVHLKVFNYKCDTCEYGTNNRSNLEYHTKTKHLKVFNYKCETCDYNTNNKANLENHVKSKHLKIFNYKCASCDYHTNNRSNFENHVRVRHLKVFNYRCEVCDYGASQKSHLAFHVRAKHSKESNYRCEVCDFKTIYRSNLESHMKSKHLEEYESEAREVKTE